MIKTVCLWLTLFIPNWMAYAQGVLYGNNPAVGRYQPIKGIQLYYEVYGKGMSLLLIHGNGDSIHSFSQTIPYFAQHYQVIAVDSRAHGKSTAPADCLSFEMMADDFADLLTSLRIDSAYVMGWSDGGINAILLALRHPRKVKKLVLKGINLWADSTTIVPSLWQQMQRGYADNKDSVFTEPTRKNAWKAFKLDVFQPHITLQPLGSIKVPALIVAGDGDVIVTEHTVAIARSLPNAWLWILPNSGHATLHEHAEEFIDA